MLTLKDETPSKKLLEIPIRIGYSNRNSVIEKQILITSDEERFKILSDFFSVKKWPKWNLPLKQGAHS